MPTRRLPDNANLDHLKHQAKDLLKQDDPQTLQRIREFLPLCHQATDKEIRSRRLTLAEAQLTIAREYGYPSWAKLKRQVENPKDIDLPKQERIEDPAFRQAVDLLDQGDESGLKRHLEQHPGLVHQRVALEGGNYFQNPTLLEFIAENPIRHDTLPPNIVEITRLILEQGSKTNQQAIDYTLSLVCSGRVPREQGVQEPLIKLLVQYGANPNGAMLPALGHGEFAAVETLIEHGAKLDLVAAAATGRLKESQEQLTQATPHERHTALALAAQHGHPEIVRLLLQAGENPSRYNPVGVHSHSTPLHQAAWAGHLAVVRLLVEAGADQTLKDTLFQGTPLDWAEYGGKTEIAEYLREQ